VSDPHAVQGSLVAVRGILEHHERATLFDAEAKAARWPPLRPHGRTRM